MVKADGVYVVACLTTGAVVRFPRKTEPDEWWAL